MTLNAPHRVLWTDRAKAHLSDILNDIAFDNPDAAPKLAQKIFENVDQLAMSALHKLHFESIDQPKAPEATSPGIMSKMSQILPVTFPATPWNVLGLMSGTSADGTDAAMIRVNPSAFRNGDPFLAFLGHRHLPYPTEFRNGILAAASDALKPSELCILQRRLGTCHAEAGLALVQELGITPHFASLHGQTIQHWPDCGATLQLADPYVLAEALECPVIWDLRRRDMALGGQGAPLVPMTELWLHGQTQPWAALNLGGIANITIWDGARVQAWDLGPAMSLLDLAAQRWLNLPFDPEGAQASGEIAQELLKQWLTHPYFSTAPPKSTGREVFGAAWLQATMASLERLPTEDRLATLAAFTAEACSQELNRWGHQLPLGSPLWISGGGARHSRLRQELTTRLPRFQTAEDHTFPSGAREAVSWALLGAASAAGVPGNLTAVTGAKRPGILGSWTAGMPERG